MSKIDEESPKHCGAKQGKTKVPLSSTDSRRLLRLLSALLTILALAMLAGWLILRPREPQFWVREAEVYQLNLSTAPHLLNSSLQVTLFSHNPNSNMAIFYDALRVYAAYKGQQITLGASLPPFYQDRHDTNLLTASLSAAALPVAPSFRYEVQRDQTAGKIALNLKAEGALRWKVGAWVSGRYRFFVNCVAVMPFGPALPSAPLTLNHATHCSTQL